MASYSPYSSSSEVSLVDVPRKIYGTIVEMMETIASYSPYSSSSQVSLVDVPRKTYETIVEMIESTFDPDMVGRGRDASNLDHWGISVTGIQKVENPKLLQTYNDFKGTLRKKISNGNGVKEITDLPKKIWQFKKESRHVDLNEIYLFHGTSEDAADSIIHKGFKIGATNPKSMYGQGIYLAEKITKADQYSDDREDRKPSGTELTLLLCSVLMGNAFACNKKDARKWKQPPCMLCGREDCRHGSENRYDSVLGCGPNMLFREFVVYDARQCYPEFLIKYERIGDWEPLTLDY